MCHGTELSGAEKRPGIVCAGVME